MSRAAHAGPAGRAVALFDRYDITSDADLEAAAERTSAYVAEKRAEGARVVPIAPDSASSRPLSDNPSDTARSGVRSAAASA
jgi:hypothetical protein